MKSLAVLVFLALALAGCATPEQDKTTADAQTAKKCEEAPTGSNVRRCEPFSRVGTITRDELERTGMPSSGSPAVLKGTMQ